MKYKISFNEKHSKGFNKFIVIEADNFTENNNIIIFYDYNYIKDEIVGDTNKFMFKLSDIRDIKPFINKDDFDNKH